MRHSRSTLHLWIVLVLGTGLSGVGRAESADARREELMMLLVDKKTLSAELRTLAEESLASRLLRRFRIAVGKVDGDKEHQGDNRTPEGVYFALNQMDARELPQKYGSGAITLNFPNPIDQDMGKTGYGIWLHGVDDNSRIEKAKVTEGCVVFYNQDLQRLRPWLAPHQGVVVIARDIAEVNAKSDVESVRAATRMWMDAWRARRVQDYISFYDSGFRLNGMDIRAYRDYKKKVFSAYQDMELLFDRVRVITHPKYAVSIFNQDFRGDDKYTSDGRKVLYWSRGADGSWKIRREVFEEMRFEPKQVAY